MLYGLDTAPLGSVLGEVIARVVSEREPASTVVPPPQAVNIANTISDNRP